MDYNRITIRYGDHGFKRRTVDLRSHPGEEIREYYVDLSTEADRQADRQAEFPVSPPSEEEFEQATGGTWHEYKAFRQGFFEELGRRAALRRIDPLNNPHGL